MKLVRQVPFFAAAVLCCVIAAAEDYRIHSRTVPPGYEREAAFFELVKWPTAPNGFFDANKAPQWDLAKVVYYIPASGIEFVDPNHYLEGHKTKREIATALKQRKGDIFRVCASLAHLLNPLQTILPAFV